MGSLFNSHNRPPTYVNVPAELQATPAPEPVPVMPTPDDAAIKSAKRRSVAVQRARHGRLSTIFTDQGSPGLGG